MPRAASYTDAEDRILLRHANQPATIVNAALAEAGFAHRSAQQLSQRRYYLRRRRPVAQVASSGSNAIIALEAERNQVLREIDAIDKQRAKLENRLRDITDALVGRVAALEADVARVARNHPALPTPTPADGNGDEPNVAVHAEPSDTRRDD
jgi:hypothetical protein